MHSDKYNLINIKLLAADAFLNKTLQLTAYLHHLIGVLQHYFSTKAKTHTRMKYSVIIVAGGKGLRMGGDLPKQYIPIQGKPILMRTIEAFHQFNAAMQIILVLPADHQSYWKELCTQYSFTIKHEVAQGGETRFHSVNNGLQLAKGEIVGVHDGVRPFVSQEVIERCYKMTEKTGATIPVIPVVESVRLVQDGQSEAVNRDAYRLVQTPQVFSAEVLRKAYMQEFNSLFTDDASVVEAAGHAITLVEGNRENIKITTPFDLKISSALL